MNSLFKATLVINRLKPLVQPIRNILFAPSLHKQDVTITRNLWHLSNIHSQNNGGKHNKYCMCGCTNTAGAHTKAAKELVEFLAEEILAERKAQKLKTIPTELDGFTASLNGAEVTLTKKTTDTESITITFNVNHSVDSDAEPELNENLDKPEIGELKSKPPFKIDLTRGETTISILCSYVPAGEQEDGYNDSFGIDEISIYNGEWNENVYSVSGEVLDSYLYDLILNYLEEQGISNEFVQKLSDYSTAYEHSAYISLLEGLSKFITKK